MKKVLDKLKELLGMMTGKTLIPQLQPSCGKLQIPVYSRNVLLCNPFAPAGIKAGCKR
jgi:hypothetical protein